MQFAFRHQLLKMLIQIDSIRKTVWFKRSFLLAGLVILAFGFQNCNRPNFSAIQTEASIKPATVNSYVWVGTNWSICTNLCGSGTQTRSVTCQQEDGTVVNDSNCSNPKPVISQACNVQACEAYMWIQSGFTPCSVSCGGGTQTQTVSCKNAQNQTVSNSFCSGTQPATSQGCNTNVCSTPVVNICSPNTQKSCSLSNGTGMQTCNSTGSAWGNCVQTSILCGADVVNNPNVDAGPSLQSCLNTQVPLVQLLPGRYYIASTLDLGSRSNVTIQTQGVTSGPACISNGAAACAILTASPTNPGPVILNSKGASNLILSYIALDGNMAQRRTRFKNSQWTQGIAYNAKIHTCNGCKFKGFASVRAPQGTGMEFDGDNAVFDTVLFRDNGWGIMNSPGNSEGLWADGLTVWSSNNLHIFNSTFMDNSDVDLIIGNGQNALIENNVFGHSNNFAFAALMLDNFNNGMPGIFTGAIVRNNQINCGNGMCGIGISVGPHIWYNSAQIVGGTIYSNTVQGARQGILTAGATGAEIYGNTISSFGNYVGNSCTTNLISWSNGDKVNIHNNSTSPVLSQLVGCAPQVLSALLSNVGSTDPQVAQAYRDILGRDPDSGGGAIFTADLRQGRSIQSIRTEIANSLESQNLLNKLYNRILGRNIDTSGAQVNTNYLVGGGSVAQIYVNLQLSPEGLSQTYLFENWSN